MRNFLAKSTSEKNAGALGQRSVQQAVNGSQSSNTTIQLNDL